MNDLKADTTQEVIFARNTMVFKRRRGSYPRIETISGRESDVANGSTVISAESKRIKVKDDDRKKSNGTDKNVSGIDVSDNLLSSIETKTSGMLNIFSGEKELTNQTLNNTNWQSSWQKTDIEDPKYKLPFIHGWTREVVYRKNSKNKKCDVYYLSPKKQKCHSLVDIIHVLQNDNCKNLKTENFTFAPKTTGVNDLEMEIIRWSNSKIEICEEKSGKENELTNQTLNNTNRQSSWQKTDIEDPKYKLPFIHGWIREVVYHENSKNRKCDVYYLSPKNQKCCSLVDIIHVLRNENCKNLKIENFTFVLKTTGVNSLKMEIIRWSNSKIEIGEEKSGKENNPISITQRTSGKNIKTSDLKTVFHPKVNYQVINHYLQIIVNRDPTSCLAMDVFFFRTLERDGYKSVRKWSSGKDIFLMKKIFIPIYWDNHWCLVLVNFTAKTMNYYDSLKKTNHECLNIIMEYLKQEHLNEKKKKFDIRGWKLGFPNCPEQTNGHDCAVFTCIYADYLARDADLDFTQNDITELRLKICYEILING